MTISSLHTSRFRTSLLACLGVVCLASLAGCGTSVRDSFYRSRVTGIAPVERGAPASASVFRSEDPEDAG